MLTVRRLRWQEAVYQAKPFSLFYHSGTACLYKKLKLTLITQKDCHTTGIYPRELGINFTIEDLSDRAAFHLFIGVA